MWPYMLMLKTMDKKIYVPPTITKIEIEIEESIGAGSARIDTFGFHDEITENWIEDDNETKSFTW